MTSNKSSYLQLISNGNRLHVTAIYLRPATHQRGKYIQKVSVRESNKKNACFRLGFQGGQ